MVCQSEFPRRCAAMKGPSDVSVLLVEHDASVSTALERDLSAHGYDVSCYPDYRGTLAHVESPARVSILVTSVVLPAGTPHGLALANMALQKRPGLPVIYLASDPDCLQWLDTKSCTVLFKPVDGQRLIEEIFKVLGA